MYRKHNKQDILHQGQELVRKQGFNATGINDILKATGIPKGSFYNFFDSKEDFGLQLLAFYGEKGVTCMRAVLDDKGISPLERLDRFYAVMASENEEECFQGGCLINNLSMEVAGSNDAFSKATNDAFLAWVELLASCIREGQEQGEIIDHYPAVMLASFFHSNIFGALSRSKSARTREQLDITRKLTLEFLAKSK